MERLAAHDFGSSVQGQAVVFRQRPDFTKKFTKEESIWHFISEKRLQILLRRRPKDPSIFTSGLAMDGRFCFRIRRISRRFAPPSLATWRVSNRNSRSATARSWV